MTEQTTYLIRVYEIGRRFDIPKLRHESNNPLDVLAEYEKYKRILNPQTTSIILGASKKTIEDLSEEELKKIATERRA